MVAMNEEASTTAFQRRVVLLGASNITLGLPVILELLRNNCASPVDVYSAHGLGRSYGRKSMVLGRSLPGILESQLWPLLPTLAPLPLSGLITDIGNDLLYHVKPEQICAWVEECVDRLEALGGHVSVTLLPICNLEHLGPARFYVFRTLFFPTCRLSFGEIVARAEELNRLVEQLAERKEVRTVRPISEWFAVDAIHIAPHYFRTAWSAYLDPMLCHIGAEPESYACASASHVLEAGADLAHTAGWMLKTPDCRWVLGMEQHGSQPARRYGDGTTISLY